MQVINDAISFIKTLTYIDVIFFIAVLSLMLLIITLIYFIEENKNEEIDTLKDNKEPKEDSASKEIEDLKAITALLENAEDNTIDLNKYEVDQEEKAIISYDELLKRKNDFALNYSEEENFDDDLTVKKVDLDNLINKDVKVTPEIKVTVFSYEKEEAFLEALKALQQKLN